MADYFWYSLEYAAVAFARPEAGEVSGGRADMGAGPTGAAATEGAGHGTIREAKGGLLVSLRFARR